MERTKTDPDWFIAQLPAEVGGDIAELDARISQVFSEGPRVMWEGKFWGGSDQKIIGYGNSSYTNASGKAVHWFVVGLAAQKNYISVYVNAVDSGSYLLQQFKGRLGKVKTGSASLSFTSLDALDLMVFDELIDRARSLTGSS